MYDEIIPNLFLSSQLNSHTVIPHCSSAFAVLDSCGEKPGWIRNYQCCELIDSEDEPVEDLQRAVQDGISFIEKHINDGVVVYCEMGVSRSATVVIAYLMKTLNVGYEKALKLVQAKRHVQPNPMFEKYLKWVRFQ